MEFSHGGEHEPKQNLSEMVEAYRNVTTPNNQLSLGRLKLEAPNGEELVYDTALHELIEEIGWPAEQEDGTMLPRRAYESPAQFAYYLKSGTDMEDKGLNNFNLFLKLKPHQLGEDIDLNQILMVAYKATPAFMRAYAVAPDLLDAVREECKDVSPYQMSEFMLEKPEIAEAALSVYQLMGRLVKPDDGQIQTELGDKLNPSLAVHRSRENHEPFEDIHYALVR